MEASPTRGAGRFDLLLLAGALLLTGVVGWILLSGPSAGTDGAGGGGVAESSGAGDGGASAPRAGRLEGEAPDRPPAPHVPQSVPPPDRAFAGVGANEARIRGRVTAPDWVQWPASVSVALVRQGEREALQSREATAQRPGFAFDPVPFGHYAVILRAREFVTQKALLTADEDHPDLYQQLPLIPGTRIVGRVLDERGRPVAGMPVTAVPVSERPGAATVPREERTGAEGRFRIAGLRPGTYEVFAGSYRQPLCTAERLRVTRESVEAWAELVVPAMGSARVTLDFGGEPPPEEELALLRVQALRRTDAGDRGHAESRGVDAGGVAAFPVLPPGDYAFTAYGGPYRRTTRRAGVIEDQETEVSIPLRPLDDGDGGR